MDEPVEPFTRLSKKKLCEHFSRLPEDRNVDDLRNSSECYWLRDALASLLPRWWDLRPTQSQLMQFKTWPGNLFKRTSLLGFIR